MRLTDLFENNRIAIFETGDSPFPYSLSFQTSNLYIWEFRPTEKLDIKYEVTFQRGGLAKYPRVWSMEFGTFGPDRPLHDPYALNNLAKNKIVSATRLFSTIYNILLDFIKAESATEIMFSAKEPVRIESYKNIVPKLARRLGWQYQSLPYQSRPDSEELTLFRIFNNGQLLEASMHMDGFWITDNQEILYIDHAHGIHHNEIAAQQFPLPDIDHPDFDIKDLPANAALAAGWIRVNTTPKSLNIQFYNSRVRRATIRKLLEFIMPYKNRYDCTFFLDDQIVKTKTSQITFHELQDTLKYYSFNVKK